MARSNFNSLLDKGFNATVHFSLRILTDLLKNALAEEIIPTGFKLDTEEVSFHDPVVSVMEVSGEPLETLIFEHPEDREEQDILIEVNVKADLLSQNKILKGLNVSLLSLDIITWVRPYYSPSKGIGIVFYKFEIDILDTKPTDLDDNFKNGIEVLIVNKLVPVINDYQDKLFFKLPKVDNLNFNAIKIFPRLDQSQMAIISIGTGENLSSADLLPLLDDNDDLMMSVSKKLFDEKIAVYNKSLPSTTRNWKENRKETIRYINLKLIENGVELKTKVFVEPNEWYIPNATITAEGPIYLSFNDQGYKSTLVVNTDNVEVNADIDWALRILADLFTLGLAEFKISPSLDDAESAGKKSISEQIASTLSKSLLSSFPAGMEFIGKNVFMLRDSAVFWCKPDAFKFTPQGFYLGGSGLGGIKYSLRILEVTAVHNPKNTIKSYAFNNEFHLTKEKTVEHFINKKIMILGVMLKQRNNINYFQYKPDNQKENNLIEKPYFNPSTATDLKDANMANPPEIAEKFHWNENGEFTVL